MGIVLTENKIITDFLKEECNNDIELLTKIIAQLIQEYKLKNKNKK